LNDELLIKNGVAAEEEKVAVEEGRVDIKKAQETTNWCGGFSMDQLMEIHDISTDQLDKILEGEKQETRKPCGGFSMDELMKIHDISTDHLDKILEENKQHKK
jgi:hypothetical protein